MGDTLLARRERIAARMLQALLCRADTRPFDDRAPRELATASVRFADALMAELDADSQGSPEAAGG